MKILLIILLALLTLASCRTVKNIETIRVEVDSTAVRERDSVINVKRLDSAAYESMIKMLSENTIIFQDTGRVVTKIEYRPDGSIKSVEGHVKSLSAKLLNEQKESGYWRSMYDSLAKHGSRDTTSVKTDIKYVDREVKRSVFPGWIWIVIVVAALGGIWVGVKYHRKFTA